MTLIKSARKEVITMKKQYKIIEGTSFSVGTPDKVIAILESVRKSRARVRVFYGDDNGKDWMEENDTIGYIGRSNGSIKIPLLVRNSRSYGGEPLLDDCIKRITIDKREVYRAKDYSLPCLTIKKNKGSLPFSVYVDGKTYANFASYEKALNYVGFLRGERNRI